MIRKTVFWMHLVCGVSAGLVVLMMSVTGVILTYERQILAWADTRLYPEPDSSAERMPVEALLARARLAEPAFEPTSIEIRAGPRALVSLGAGRSRSRYVDPTTGTVLGEGAAGLREFFSTVTSWHRWFNASGEDRARWRAITGASNLMFLFLVLSGTYLWLPRVYKWAMFRTRLFFTATRGSGRARDFNWHHVFGIWSAVPLTVVVATAVVFSYSWGNDLVYRTFGEEPPARGRGGPPVSNAQGSAPAGARLSLDELFTRAAAHREGWRAISMRLPADDASEVRFTIDEGNGGQPQRRHSLTLDARTGEVVTWAPFASQSPGRQARIWVRFLHTGEALGLVGQTIAGIVSLTSIVMVWTGLALAYRRLVVPLFRGSRRRAA